MELQHAAKEFGEAANRAIEAGVAPIRVMQVAADVLTPGG